ncbi:MAG TPA: hypothetical protein VLG44_00535 [Chlamydiales bacterium]|nr:hypothetical protein [Chlamydiales bacterium]
MSVQATGFSQSSQAALAMGAPEIDGFLVVSQTVEDIAEVSFSDFSETSLTRDLSHTEVEVDDVDDHELSLSESNEEPAKDWLDEEIDSASERGRVQQLEFDEPSSDDEIGSMVLTKAPITKAKREMVDDEEIDGKAFKAERRMIRRERRITILQRRIERSERILEIQATAATAAAVDDQQDEQSSCGIIDRVTGFACDVFKNGYQLFQLGATLLSNRRLFA